MTLIVVDAYLYADSTLMWNNGKEEKSLKNSIQHSFVYIAGYIYSYMWALWKTHYSAVIIHHFLWQLSYSAGVIQRCHSTDWASLKTPNDLWERCRKHYTNSFIIYIHSPLDCPAFHIHHFNLLSLYYIYYQQVLKQFCLTCAYES